MEEGSRGSDLLASLDADLHDGPEARHILQQDDPAGGGRHVDGVEFRVDVGGVVSSKHHDACRHVAGVFTSHQHRQLPVKKSARARTHTLIYTGECVWICLCLITSAHVDADKVCVCVL